MGEPERFGAYLVHERLGAGGMAEVHRAQCVPPSPAPAEREPSTARTRATRLTGRISGSRDAHG